MSHDIQDAPEERVGALTDKFLSDAQTKYYREHAIAVGKRDAAAGKPRYVPDKLYGHGIVEEGYYIGYDQASKRLLRSLDEIEREGIRSAAEQNLHAITHPETRAW